MQTVRWGILGPGKIALSFAEDFQYSKGGVLQAVASRDIHRAEEFTQKFRIPFAYGSYEQLIQSEEVDVIYIATPHSTHFELTRMCLLAGKSVLCEKPLTLNARQATQLFKIAKTQNCFLMEALWSKFNPTIRQLYQIIAAGEIGEVKRISSNFGFVADPDPASRLRNPSLAGGALLDIGIYALLLPHLLWGKPEKIESQVNLSDQGVDSQEQIIMSWSDGRMAVAEASLDCCYPNKAVISGTLGYIELPEQFFCSKFMTLTRACHEEASKEDRQPVLIENNFPGMGYQFEVNEVNQCLAGNKIQSDIHSWSETLALSETMDQLRLQWGISYPGEID